VLYRQHCPIASLTHHSVNKRLGNFRHVNFREANSPNLAFDLADVLLMLEARLSFLEAAANAVAEHGAVYRDNQTMYGVDNERS